MIRLTHRAGAGLSWGSSGMGRLELGPRQFIMYGDFDGCREKTVLVKIIGE